MTTELLPEEQEVIQDARPRIVLVDDDTDQLQVLAYRFEQQGFETFTAKNGEAGISMVQSVSPDAVLMDLGLPDSNGFDVCRKITDDPKTCQIPVIILSGIERDEIVRQTRIAGAAFYVRKPYDPSALLLLVNKAIDDASSYL